MSKYGFIRIEKEQPIDPHSGFWAVHVQIDNNGNPLDLLCRAEDGEEVATEILACLHQERRQEVRSSSILHPAQKSITHPSVKPSQV